MIYSIHWKRNLYPNHKSHVRTRDCIIVEATPAMKWSIGKHIHQIMIWAANVDAKVNVLDGSESHTSINQFFGVSRRND